MATNILGIKITAQDATAGAVRSAVAGMQSLQTAAGGANRVLAGLGVGVSVGAFVAYTKSIIDGVDALNDLKDATGASIENISALEDVARRSGASLDAVGTSLVKLNQALSAAKPGSATEAAVKAIGLSVSELKALDPAEAFRRIAVGLEGFADDANKARLTQELFGKSLKEVAPLLKDLAAQGTLNATVTTAQAEAAEKFNKQLFSLQTNVTTAARALLQEMIPAISATAAEFSNGIKYAGGFWNALSVVGATNPLRSVSGQIAVYREEIEDLTGSIERYKRANSDTRGLEQALKVAQQRLEYFKSLQRFEIESADPGDVSDALSRRTTSANRPSLPASLSGTTKPTGISAAQKLINDGLALYNDLMAEAAGYSKTYTEDVTKLAAAYQATSMTAAQYATALAAINAAQPGAVEAEKARLDAAKLNTQAVDELFDAQEKLRLANEDQIKTGRTMLEQIEYETRLLGLSAEQRALATLERELETQGIVKGTQAYDAYIDKLREATAIKTAKEAGIESVKTLADANKKAAEESSKYWEDALMRAFESGKGFFESLWDTIKNTLKTQVLKVLVTGTMTGIATVANATGSVAGNAVGSLLGGAATSAGTGTLTSLLGSSSMGSLDIAGVAVGGPAGIALAAAAAALYAIFGNNKTPSSGTGEGNILFDAAGNVTGSSSRYSGSWGLTSEVEKSIQGVASAYYKAAAGLGIGTVAAEFAYGGNTGKEGKDPQFALGVNAGGVSYSSGEIKLTDENVQLAASRAVFAALQGSDLPNYLEGVFDGLTASTATQDQITAVLNNAKAYKDFHTALTALPWENLTSMSYKAAKGLADAAGGLEALGNNLAGFYQNFYTEAEQTENLTRALGDGFTALGLTMPTDKLREWYRGQVEAALALDQTIPANAAYTAGLLSMQGGVNTLADSAETAAQRIIDAAAKLQEQIFAAQESAMSEYMSAQLEYNSLIASEQEQAAQAMQAAADALASAGQGIQAFIDSLLNTPANAKDNYLSDLALARGGDVEASKRLPTSGRAYLDAQIAASTTSAEARIAQARMAAELSNLPAVKSYEQQLLEAVGGTTAAVKDLNGKLITELTVTARSEITKLINFVANTDDLPTDLKELALGATSTFTKTVEYVLGSVLSPDMQALALEQNSTLTKTVRLALGDDLPDETKRIVLMASESVSKTIGLVAFSTMSADQQAMVLQTTGSITKTISLAAGELDQVALGVAFAQSGTIERIVRASGGNLTAEQQQLLSAVDVYNKTVNIDVNLDATELTAFQTMLKEIFGTISIPGITGDGLGGVDLTDIVGQAYLDRLQSINTYINSLDWSLENSKASAWATYYAAQQYGVSQADIANATGLNYSDIQALFDSANVPRFAMGTNYLPSDMLAQVHQGERIIPAADNRELMSRLQDPQANSEALVTEVRALREENRAQSRAMVQMQQRLTKLMERWDSNGLPTERLET